MKKTTIISVLGILLLSLNICTYAQKLPNVQTASIPAPADIKIDGKATEWNNQFQAFNHAVLFNYTLANDKDNLYLAVQATDQVIVKRILNGGITLAISAPGDKKDKNAPGVTFPVSSPGNKVTINFKTKPDPAAMPAQADSFMRAKNNEMGTKFKNIKTNGISQLDTLISVYNTNNIKAAGALDINMAYTYELAIPLKYLKINTDKFAYHVTINAVAQTGISMPNMNSTDPMQKMRGIRVSPNAVLGQEATDFWGEYTLAH